jgi:hypothetical protein
MPFHSGLFGPPSSDPEEDHTQHEEIEEEPPMSPPPSPPRSEDVPIATSNKKKRKRPQTSDERRAALGIQANAEPFRFPDTGVHFNNDDLANGAGALPEDGVAPPQHTPFNPEEVDWEGVSEEDHGSSDEEHCPDCENDQNEDQREANPAVQMYRDHYIENCHAVEPRRLTRQVQRIFNRRVRRFTDDRKPYLKRMIAKHFEEHEIIPEVIRGKELRNLNYALKVMRENSIYRKDQEGRVSLDPSQMRLYMQIMNQRNALMDKVFSSKKSTT